MCKSQGHGAETPPVEAEFLRGLLPYTEHEANNLCGSRRVAIARSDEHVRDFVERSLLGEYRGKKLLLGKIDAGLAQRIHDKTGVDFNGYNLEFRSDEIAHTFKEHGAKKTELPRGQQPISAEDIVRFPSIVFDFDDVLLTRDNGLHFMKNINGRITAVTIYADGNRSLALKTMYMGKNRREL